MVCAQQKSIECRHGGEATPGQLCCESARFLGDGARRAPAPTCDRPPAPAPTAHDCPNQNTANHVAVLGAGHGGLALAGWLAQRGHRVALWNRSGGRIAPVAALGSIQLTLPGLAPAPAPVAVATNSIAAVLAKARHVAVAVPACAHADVARECAPFLRDGQTVLLLPGRTGGTLEFRRVLRQAGCRARILLGEANTFPFVSRNVGPGSAVIYGTKDEVRAAALPATRTSELIAAWRPLLPMLSSARSVLHTGLANLGAILHPTITLLNADRIKRGDAFDFYSEGVTPRVAVALARADAERLEIARAYGVMTCRLQDWIGVAYGHHATDMLAAVGGNPAYVGVKAPLTLQHRYLLEDVPTGLIPLIELGDAAGVPVPTLKGLAEQGRAALGGMPWERPRTLNVLGLDSLDARAICSFVERGFVPIPMVVRPARSISFVHSRSPQELSA